MKVTIWGARGSIPVPGATTVRYGGNTPCVTVEEGRGLLVLDAGTGIRRLGEALGARRHGDPIDILLSHTHWDHIQGLPFFAPLYEASRWVRIFGPAPEVETLREVLVGQMTPPVWPVAYVSVAERLDVTEITAEELRTDYFEIRTVALRHPGRTLGYSISNLSGGLTLNYLTDNELGNWNGKPEWQARLVGFLRDGEVLIHDATYDDAEIPTKQGWGHSSASQATDLAIATGVRKLILFHHAPEHSDEVVDRMLAESRRRVAATGATLVVEAAAEGQSFDV